MPLPSGTVTFLFTDIQGSTKLWEEHPQAMRTALARHDELLRQAIVDNDGVVFKTIGDAFCAAFATAPDALAAALSAQLALRAEVWPDTLSLRVRMALHTGTAELRDNDYFGQPLNRVARLLAIGHGGQVLISAATQELTRDNLPPAVTLQDVGEHRLRDLGRPEVVFQLLHPALPSEFAPLKSLDNPDLPNNLPQQVTSFIGREKEMDAVKTLLGKTRLLTLTGSGGCGKTRLGLQVAAEVLDDFPDGVWLVELASLADPALVPQAVASVLGVREEAGQPLLQTLVTALKDKKMLLVLDNCEHVLTACALLVDTLIRACPHVRVLVSSREGLRIAGELTYRIPSLSLPDPKQTVTVENIGQYEAVQLFIERALFHLPAFVVTNANAPALASVCHRLDGIPLAIELAAARVRSMSVEEVNARLDNRFRLLTGGSRTALPRQQTLRALIDWSYDLLTEPEKALLLRLSVFAGGWGVVSAGQVCAGEGVEEWELLDLLTALVDKSLVVYEEQAGEGRYRLLETIRQYARDRLMESEEANAWRMAHRDYFLRLAEKAQGELKGPEQGMWLHRLQTEHDNLRGALDFCLEAPEEAQAGLQLAGALQQFWWTFGCLSEGRVRLAAMLARPEAQEPTKVRANALYGAGVLTWMQGDYAAARSLHEESLALGRGLGDKQGIANALGGLGLVASDQGDYKTARFLHEESLALRREVGDRQAIARSLNNLGIVANQQGDYAAARSLYEEGLTIQRELGDKWGIAISLSNLGVRASDQGDQAAARSLFQESLVLRRELGDKQGIFAALNGLGGVANQQGDYAAARSLYEEGLALGRELGDKHGLAISLVNLGSFLGNRGDTPAAGVCLQECITLCRELGEKRIMAYVLEGYAQLAHQQQQPEQAARLLGAAWALRVAINSALPPHAQEETERIITDIREILDDAAFALAWAQGRAMTMEQAIQYAMELGKESL